MEDLKAMRIAAGLSMRQLAEKTGIHYQTINNIEKGKHQISDLTRHKLETFFENQKGE